MAVGPTGRVGEALTRAATETIVKSDAERNCMLKKLRGRGRLRS